MCVCVCVYFALKNIDASHCHRFFVVKEGSSDYKRVRKRWFFKEPLTEWFFCNIWFFYGIAVKNLFKHLYF